MNSRRWLLSLVAGALLLCGCSTAPLTKTYDRFDPQTERESIYIVPFDTTLVPPDFGEPVFDQFVDLLNARRDQTKVGRFIILKEELSEVEPAWLTRQTYISGDIWGYIESTGCCSTEVTVKSKIQLYEPGRSTPTFEVYVPVEYYFSHDRGDIAGAKELLGKKLAQDLTKAVIKKLTP